MEDCFFESVVFKSVWTPSLGEVLGVKEEQDNEHGIFAVSVEKAGMMVGHVPHRIFTFFIRHGVTIICEVTGHRRLGNGLEVPCRNPKAMTTDYVEE